MNRRVFLKSTSIIAAASASSGILNCSQVNRQKPNIVYILADDLGYGDLGCYGQKKIETPNIDALAKNGLTFSQHYSGAPVCAPARCVLLTGKHTGHAYIRGNDEWRERGDVWDYAKAVDNPNLEGQRPIPKNTVTIARLLQSAGYKTGIIGKWGLGGPLTEGIPTRQGFDFFFGYNCQRQAHTYYPKHLWRNEKKVWLDNPLVVPRDGWLPDGADPMDSASYAKFSLNQYAPDLMFDELMGFVEAYQKQPFFLYWATPIPHVALQAPQRWIDYYVKKFGDEKPYLGNRGYFPHRYPHAAYAAMISYLDEQVGLLIDKLKTLGLYEKTLIVFTSDNGPTYAGGADSEYFNSAGLFHNERGRTKGSVNEGGVRVPMIASWEGHIAQGTQTDHLSIFYDVLPTLCEVAGVSIPENADGISFLPVLTGDVDGQKEHEFLYWEFEGYGGQQAVRMGPWKGIRKNLKKAGNLTMALYNLEEDIQETTDVAAQHPDIVQRIEAIMKREHTQAEIKRFRFKVLGDEI